MKTRAEMQELLRCKYHQVKNIAQLAGWTVVRKRGYVFYNVTDEQVNAYLANPIITDNHDYTFDLWKATLNWMHKRDTRYWPNVMSK